MILDEPTSVLTPQEADDVLGMLRGLCQNMQLSMAMITHKFREVKAFADEVTVLRRGRFAGTGRASELNAAQLAEMMVGAEPPASSITRSPGRARPQRCSRSTTCAPTMTLACPSSRACSCTSAPARSSG
jgi:simple sugar transport system ATP-binding protein